MSEIVNRMKARGGGGSSSSCSSALTASEDPHEVERRIFRTMSVAVIVAVCAGMIFAPWRVTTGVALGGVLSLVNYHWLRTAIATAFESEIRGAKPKIRIARYLLRYFIIGAIIAAAYLLNVVSLTATLFGLCSFAVGIFREAIRQIYFAIVYRGEN